MEAKSESGEKEKTWSTTEKGAKAKILVELCSQFPVQNKKEEICGNLPRTTQS